MDDYTGFNICCSKIRDYYNRYYYFRSYNLGFGEYACGYIGDGKGSGRSIDMEGLKTNIGDGAHGFSNGNGYCDHLEDFKR